MAQDKSAASVEITDTVVVAACGIPEVRLFTEYATITSVDQATAIVNDAIATGTLLRSNGTALKDFPSYYQLRFIATQEGNEKVDRGFYKANNARKVRAAALKVYENSPKPASDGTTTVRTRSPKVEEIGEYIQVRWMGDVTRTMNTALFTVQDYQTRRTESENGARERLLATLTEKMGMSIEQIKALVATM